jgi:hypothetical protein
MVVYIVGLIFKVPNERLKEKKGSRKCGGKGSVKVGNGRIATNLPAALCVLFSATAQYDKTFFLNF